MPANKIANPFIDPTRNELVVELLTIGSNAILVVFTIITLIAYYNLNSFINNSVFSNEITTGSELIKFGYALMLIAYLIDLLWLLTVLIFNIGVVISELPPQLELIFTILKGIFLMTPIPLFIGHLRTGKHLETFISS